MSLHCPIVVPPLGSRSSPLGAGQACHLLPQRYSRLHCHYTCLKGSHLDPPSSFGTLPLALETPLVICCDNKSAVKSVENTTFCLHTKHDSVCYRYICEGCNDGSSTLNHPGTNEMPTDMSTRPPRFTDFLVSLTSLKLEGVFLSLNGTQCANTKFLVASTYLVAYRAITCSALFSGLCFHSPLSWCCFSFLQSCTMLI